MAFSFIIPDAELNLRLARALAIIKHLSLNSDGQLILSAEKIAFFDFFLLHPAILHSVLKYSGKKNFVLESNELLTISAEYPNTNSIFHQSDIKRTLQILLLYKFVSSSVTNENQAVFALTEIGEKFLSECRTEYLARLEELCVALKPYQNKSYRQLFSITKPFINGH